MSKHTVLKRIVLKPEHKPTGKTRHFKAIEVNLDLEELYIEKSALRPPKSLEIIQFEGDKAYYLIYKDEFDQELTDTYHESLESAINQAEWEFNVKSTDW
jgi:hypothetical protein